MRELVDGKAGPRPVRSVFGLGLLFFCLLAVFFLSGCGGKAEDAGEAVAEEITGARKIKQGEDLKNQLRQINRQREAQEKEARGE